MTYELAFDRRALKEWQKLGHTIREQFKKKLAERLENPRVPAARLHGHADRSFNWFSATREDKYQRYDTSLVYRGEGVKNEIKAIYGSLDQRQL